MKEYLLPVLLALCLTVTPVSAQQDRKLGSVYMEQAAALFRSGDRNAARDLLSRAEQFLESSSDAEYLKGSLLEGDSDLSGAYFRRALALESWQYFSPADAVEALIPGLFARKRYDDLIRWAEDRVQLPRPDARILWMYAYAENQGGRHDTAVAILREALVLFPRDENLYSLLFRISPEDRDRYGRRILEGGYPSGDNLNRLLCTLLPLMEKEEPRRALLALYDRLDLYCLPVEVMKIRLNGLVNPADLDRLAGAGLFRDGILTRNLYETLAFDSQKTRLQSLFDGYTGPLEEDGDGDGIPELSMELRDGQPVSFCLDADQDGLFEARILYSQGHPSEFLSQEPVSLRIRYDYYPWAEEMTVRRDERVTVYRIIPGNAAVPVELWTSPFVSFAPEPLIPDWPVIQAASRSVALYLPGETSPLEEYVPYFGHTGETRVYPSGKADFSRNFFIRQGLVFKETQDLVGGSAWDTIRYYEEGFLRMITHDADEDSFYEYREEPRDGGYRLLWDFNQNGYYDCRQTRVDGTILREYSSGDNGIYDILIQYEDGN